MAIAQADKLSALSKLCGEKSALIEVDTNFTAAEGQELIDHVVVGPLLGAGLQGEVRRLDFRDGCPTGWVLKSATGKLLAGLMPPMAQEWAIGRQLVLALSTQSESKKFSAAADPLRGFMRTGAAVVRRPAAAARGPGEFRGQVLELMQGEGADAVLRSRRPGLDAGYVRRMLGEARCPIFFEAGCLTTVRKTPIFHALAAAQQSIGFKHWDLRLSNVMEHDPGGVSPAGPSDPNPTLSRAHLVVSPQPDGNDGPVSDRVCFKIIDFGHSQVVKRELQALAALDLSARTRFTERCYRLFWCGRHDVYRLLMSLQNVIDGWTWDEADRPAVEHLRQLVSHVTGVRLRAKYATGKDVRSTRSGAFRRAYMRATSFWHFRHGNTSASAALRMPFFTEPS